MPDELALRIASALCAGGMIAYAQDDERGMHVEIVTGPDEDVCLFTDGGTAGA